MIPDIRLIQPYILTDFFPNIIHYTDLSVPYPMIIYELQFNEKSSGDIAFTIIPTGCESIIIGYDDSTHASIYLVGAHKERIILNVTPYTHYYCVREKPGCYLSLDNSSTPGERFNTITQYNLDTLNSLHYLIDDLCQCDDFAAHIKAFTDYADTYMYLYEVSPAINHIITRTIEQFGIIRVSELAKELCYSERHTNYIFTNTYGYGPKDFQRYIRFQNALSEIIANPHRSNSEFITNTGYSDQAHFQREFKSFLGITPKQYIKKLTH